MTGNEKPIGEFADLESDLRQEAAAETAGAAETAAPAAGEAEPVSAAVDIDTGDLLYQILWTPLKALLKSTVPDSEIRAMSAAQGAALDLWFPQGFMDARALATLSALALTMQVYQSHRAGRGRTGPGRSPVAGAGVVVDSSGARVAFD